MQSIFTWCPRPARAKRFRALLARVLGEALQIGPDRLQLVVHLSQAGGVVGLVEHGDVPAAPGKRAHDLVVVLLLGHQALQQPVSDARVAVDLSGELGSDAELHGHDFTIRPPAAPVGAGEPRG